MATTLERERTVTPAPVRGKRPVGWALGGLAALAVAGLVVAGLVVRTTDPVVRPAEQADPIFADPVTYTDEEKAVMRLVAQGLIPEETLNGGVFLLKRLIMQGKVPRETLNPYRAPVEPLWCPNELAIMAAVNQGLVPEETLEGEPFLTKRLIQQGHIPRQAVPPC